MSQVFVLERAVGDTGAPDYSVAATCVSLERAKRAAEEMAVDGFGKTNTVEWWSDRYGTGATFMGLTVRYTITAYELLT